MNEKLKYKIRTVVEKLGVKQSLEIFGKDILKQVYMDNPSLFLNQFNNLRPVEKDGFISYVDNDNHYLFFYSKKKQELKIGECWFNYDRIWSFFSVVMGYSLTEIEEIMMDWLWVTYNLNGLVPGLEYWR